MLSPSFLAVTYINMNFFIGHYLFANKMVYAHFLSDYKLWEFYSDRMLFFNAINLIIILAYFVNFKIKPKYPLLVDLKKINQSVLIFVTLVLYIISLVFKPSFSFFGGSGNFSIIFRSFFIIVLIVFISKSSNLIKRVLLYLLTIFLFLLSSIHSKRDAIFLLLPIILLESRRIVISFSIKKILIIASVTIVMMYTIIAMSIVRGYGYKADSFVDALKYVNRYTQSSFFIPAIANNLEFSYTYLHSNNVIEHVKKGKMDFLYGETFIKPLFVLIPRSVFSLKPRSAIDHYTRSYDLKFRNRGGSYPVSIQSEFFLNFGFYSLIVAFIFFVIINGLYRFTLKLIESNNILNYVYLLYAYETYLILVRGSGLDIFTVSLIIFWIFFISYKLFVKILTQSIDNG